jgi:hypothetical protein
MLKTTACKFLHVLQKIAKAAPGVKPLIVLRRNRDAGRTGWSQRTS